MKHGKDGRLVEEYDDDDFIKIIGNNNFSTRDLSKHIGCSKRTCNRRLNKLLDDGKIRKIKYGNLDVWMGLE